MINFKLQISTKSYLINTKLSKIHRKFVYGILITFLTLNSFSQDKKYDFSSVDKIIDNAISAQTFPSAVLLVGNSKEILYQNAYARLTYDDNAKATTLKTIYDLTSVTKVMAQTSA